MSTPVATATRTTTPSVPKPRREEPPEEASAEELLSALKALNQEDPLAERLRERIMLLYRPLLHRIARRYGGRGERQEDLRQTAHVGLAKAIRGYDPERGTAFIGYLLSTVTGEIKRHFRDHTWAVHTPRDPQSRRSQLNQTRRELEQRLSRTPAISEIAKEMGISAKGVEEILLVSEAYNTFSLNVSEPFGDDFSPKLEQRLGIRDRNLDLVVERESVRAALQDLATREKLILKRRFFDEWTQAQIAEEVGCSQMHVSRLLAACLGRLREELLAGER